MPGDMEIIAKPQMPLIEMRYSFDAPRELVFKAHIDPAAVAQWWGPANLTTTVESLEARPGGLWRMVQRDADGNEFGFHGVYHDVVAPERLVYTFEFEGMPGHVLLETLTFEERDGRTILRDVAAFQSVEDRDGMLQSGMESGARESMERLTELLRKMGVGAASS